MIEKIKKPKTICVDIDDVCASLVPYWLAEYNRDYNDTLKEKDILTWDVSNYVKPECGKKIYNYLSDRNMYDGIEDVTGAVRYTGWLREFGFRLIFVTFRGDFSHSGRKFEWLNNNGFYVEDRDYVETNDKSIIYADYMIDDNYENISNFRGYGVLYTRPWNKHENHYHRVDNWKEFFEFILEKEKGKQNVWH